jgi:transcriptional regulator of acetoin/glycerol metabolism
VGEVAQSKEEVLRSVISNLNHDIKLSWIRCLNEHRLSPTSIKKPNILTQAELRDQSAPIEDLLGIASPEIKRLFARLMDSNYLVSIASREAVNVIFRCDYQLIGRMESLGVLAGSIWSEDQQGTNGIGTALRLRRPVSVLRTDHFCHGIHDLTCTAVPVFGPGNTLQCVINTTTDRPTEREAQTLLSSVLLRSARRIENAFFNCHHEHRRILRLSLETDFTDPANEARIALDDSNQVVDATSTLEPILNIRREDMLGRRISDIISLEIDRMEPDRPVFVEALLHHLNDVYALQCNSDQAAHRIFDRTGPKLGPGRDSEGGKEDFTKSVFALHPRLVSDFDRARQLASAGLPIVLRGEQGSGRQRFARLLGQALHDDFNILSCTCGIEAPEKLSALATGSGLKGAYYLEDIEALPLPVLHAIGRKVSAKLEARQTPDFSIIMGMSDDDKVNTGTLGSLISSAMEITLPPIRQYPNVTTILEHLLIEQNAASGTGPKSFAPSALKIMSAYFWEGNLQQMRLAIRYASTLATKDVIETTDLPKYIPRNTEASSETECLEAVERENLVTALGLKKWNVSQTASYLGLSRATINRRISEFGIKRP